MNEKEMEDMVLELKKMEEFINSENVRTLIKDINKSDKKKQFMSVLFMKIMDESMLTAEEKVAMMENLKFMALMDTIGFSKMMMLDMAGDWHQVG